MEDEFARKWAEAEKKFKEEANKILQQKLKEEEERRLVEKLRQEALAYKLQLKKDAIQKWKEMSEEIEKEEADIFNRWKASTEKSLEEKKRKEEEARKQEKERNEENARRLAEQQRKEELEKLALEKKA